MTATMQMDATIAAQLAKDMQSKVDEVRMCAQCATLILKYGMASKIALNLEAEHIPPRKGGVLQLPNVTIDDSDDIKWIEEARANSLRPISKDWENDQKGYLFAWITGKDLKAYMAKLGIEKPTKAKEPLGPIEFKPSIPLAPMPKNIAGPEEGVMAKAMCLTMSFGLFGNSRQISMKNFDVKDSAGQVDTKIEKSRLRAQKKLLVSPELDAIKTFDYNSRKYVRSISLPFDVAIDMVPLPAVPSVEEWLEQRAKERAEKLVPAFKEAYPKRCEESAKELGTQYRASDYVPVEVVAAEFEFSWQWFRSGVDGKLKELSKTIWQKESAKAAAKLSEATNQMQMALRAAMLELVSHMSEALKPDDDGKPRKFHTSSVLKLVNFLGNVEIRNITDDASLKPLIAQAKSLLQGQSVEAIKDNEAVRAKVQEGMGKIAAQLDGMVVKTGRKFRFDTEEE